MTSRWQKKLRTVLSDMENGLRPKSISLPAIQVIVGAPSNLELSAKAAELANQGKLVIKYRLLSPDTRVVIAQYSRLSDIPNVAFDETTDQSINVVPSRDVEVVYQVPSDN